MVLLQINLLSLLLHMVKSDEFNVDPLIPYKILELINTKLQEYNEVLHVFNWNNVTNTTRKNRVEEEIHLYNLEQQLVSLRTHLSKMHYSIDFSRDEELKRQYKRFLIQGPMKSNEFLVDQWKFSNAYIQRTYRTAKICYWANRTDCTLSMDNGLKEHFRMALNPQERLYLWRQFRRTVGRKVKRTFSTCTELSNRIATTRGFNNTFHEWSFEYENIYEQMTKVMNEIEMFYKELQAFVYHKIRAIYIDEAPFKNRLIPFHFLGDITTMDWMGFYQDFLQIEPTKTAEVTNNMRVYRNVEWFFTSLNFSQVPQSFWTKSIFKMKGDCKSTVWNFFRGKDIRLLRCNKNRTYEDSTTEAFQELTELQMYLEIPDVPILFRLQDRNFFKVSTAVGNALALSVLSTEPSKNAQLKLAFETILKLPQIFAMETWRREIFQKKLAPKDFNRRWWELREQFQGITTVEHDTEFDPAVSYEILTEVPFIGEFFEIVLRFQIHKELCSLPHYKTQNKTVPLHECNIYGKPLAGDLIKNIFRVGTLNRPDEILQYLTGSRDLNAAALLEFFQPLRKWLQVFLKDHNIPIGWNRKVELSTTSTKKTEDLGLFARFRRFVRIFLLAYYFLTFTKNLVLLRKRTVCIEQYTRMAAGEQLRQNSLQVVPHFLQLMRRLQAWPQLDQSLKPTARFYYRFILFVLPTVLPICSYLGEIVIVTIGKRLPTNEIVTEWTEVASMAGCVTLTIGFIVKVPILTEILMEYTEYAKRKPKSMEDLKRYSFYTKCFDYYINVGIAIVILMKFLVDDCSHDPEADRKLCGFVYNSYLPLQLHFGLVLLPFALCQLWVLIIFAKYGMAIAFSVLEIAQHMVVRIKVFKQDLEQVLEHASESNFRKDLGDLIEEHCKIIELTTRLRNCFREMMFIHFVMTSVILALSLFTVINTHSPIPLVRLTAWFVILCAACIGSEQLIQESTSISAVVYNSKWYQLDPQIQKDLQLMLLMAQRPLFLDPCSFSYLSLELLLKMLKSAYSYTTLLNRITS